MVGSNDSGSRGLLAGQDVLVRFFGFDGCYWQGGDRDYGGFGGDLHANVAARLDVFGQQVEFPGFYRVTSGVSLVIQKKVFAISNQFAFGCKGFSLECESDIFQTSSCFEEMSERTDFLGGVLADDPSNDGIDSVAERSLHGIDAAA